MFFPPCFRAESEITIWGPSSPEASLENRIARYISAPLSPVEVRELPCSVSFRDTPASEWELGGATIRAEAVTHRGPTLGYRITDGDTTLAYIPDHEPALGAPLAGLEPEWISGFDLARDADLLIHDCQYTDDEYPDHVGWGHSAAHRHAHLRPPGRRASGCCSSTTTRCTPTSSSTTSAPRRAQALAASSAATRPRSRWAWRAPSSRSTPRGCPGRPRLRAQAEFDHRYKRAGTASFDTGITTARPPRAYRRSRSVEPRPPASAWPAGKEDKRDEEEAGPRRRCWRWLRCLVVAGGGAAPRAAASAP